MKAFVFTMTTLAAAMAFAHGSLAQQAVDAITSANKLFAASQPKEIQRQFLSVSATKTGHEQYAVVMTLNDQTTFNFACAENEEVDPVVWECTAQ